MVKMGDADAMVSGIAHEYPDVMRPALQIFGTREGASIVCGLYIMIIRDDVYLFTDTTMNIEPNAATLSETAILANDFDMMEGLGIYEIAPEDLALCEFACTSKQPVQQILQAGLDLVKKECA